MLIWLVIGLALAGLTLAGPLRWAAGVAAFCVPLAGTAVFIVGRDAIFLPLVVSGALIARMAFSLFLRGRRDYVLALLPRDLPVLAFVAYCVFAGLFFPRLFAGETFVLSQEANSFVPLGAHMVRYVQLAYLVFGLLTYLAFRHAMLLCGVQWMLMAMIAQAAILGGFGFAQAILGLGGLNLDTKWIVNNPGYAVIQSENLAGFARVTSAFVEASAFAGWAIAPLAFFYSLYVNGVRPILSFVLMAMLGVTMLMSTSSTAYGGLAFLGFYAILHAILDPDRRRRDRGMLVVFAGALLTGVALVFVMTAESGVLFKLREMIEAMTVGKSQSSSAEERSSWAMQSVQNGFDTGLLGVGYGAARSSGLLFSLFGAVGLVGLVLFFIMLFQFLTPAFKRAPDDERRVAAAASFAVFPAVGALALSGAELGMTQIFWVFAALASAPIALRERLLAAQSITGMVGGQRPSRLLQLQHRLFGRSRRTGEKAAP